jgi:acetyl esterase/lipase
MIIVLIGLFGKQALSQTVIPLYPGKIPNAIKSNIQEKIEGSGNLFISKVTVPKLKIYLPDPKIASGTAVVICPGGGYSGLAIIHEGEQVAEAFQKIGVAAFVLQYRLPSDLTMTDKSIGPLQDAQQAIKVVREHAREWKIDVTKVGIAGFSAGGHLASTAGTHYQVSLIDNPKQVTLRPDFMILGYPVISFTDSLTHQGSRENLLGKSPSAQQIKNYSNELQVDSQTPVTFLVHAGDDDVVKVQNSLSFYKALQKNGVAAGLVIYPHGGHGFGLNNSTTPDKWFEHCKNWLASLKIISISSGDVK